jgi:hypothetical protein
MDLKEMMLTTGQFMTVANVKNGGSLEDKIVLAGATPVKVKLNVSKVEKIKFDLRYTYDATKQKGKFDLSQDFFDSVAGLNEKGTGFSEFYIAGTNQTVLVLCTEGVSNDYGVTPKILNSKKGDKKSLGFVAVSLEFYAQKSELFPKNEAGTWLFNLPETALPGVYSIEPATIELEGTVEDNSPAITENIVAPVESVCEEEPVVDVPSNIPAWVQADVTAEVTAQEEAIANFESNTPAPSMVDYANQVLASI